MSRATTEEPQDLPQLPVRPKQRLHGAATGVIARVLTVAVALIGLAAGGCTSTASSTSGQARAGDPGGGQATVVRVVDGDTIVARVRGRDERVRLLGIDTPESVKPNTPVECWGHEASAVTRRLLPPGTPIRLVRDVEARDKYGRLLAYIYLRRTGGFVNLELVQSGAAGLLTYPPNTSYADQFGAAQQQARQQRRGIWAACGGNHQPATATTIPGRGR